MDAVLVGIGTALADDPLLTARPAGPRRPARVILDGKARLPATSKLAQTAHETSVWLAVCDEAPADRLAALQALGCTILTFTGNERVPITHLLQELGRRQVTNLLVEGGGQTLGSFLDAGHVDAVEVFIAPILEGGSHPFGPARGLGSSRMADALRLDWHETRCIDADVHLRGTLPAAWKHLRPP
jgi:diaminohydroxyphosphoribosylaminopyrimidine deaminase/5-amino-6-(5-phosphoribosylamino)uracil reductase